MALRVEALKASFVVCEKLVHISPAYKKIKKNLSEVIVSFDVHL